MPMHMHLQHCLTVRNIMCQGGTLAVCSEERRWLSDECQGSLSMDKEWHVLCLVQATDLSPLACRAG